MFSEIKFQEYVKKINLIVKTLNPTTRAQISLGKKIDRNQGEQLKENGYKTKSPSL